MPPARRASILCCSRSRSLRIFSTSVTMLMAFIPLKFCALHDHQPLAVLVLYHQVGHIAEGQVAAVVSCAFTAGAHGAFGYPFHVVLQGRLSHCRLAPSPDRVSAMKLRSSRPFSDWSSRPRSRRQIG